VLLYDSAVGGLALSSSVSFPYELTTPVVTTSTVLYLEQLHSSTGCRSSRFPVKVTIHRVPDSPLVSDIYRCGSGVGVFSVTVLDMEALGVRMWDLAEGGNQLGLDNSAPYTLSTPLVGQSRSFYFDVVGSNGCVSARREARLHIQAVPGVPMASDVTRCGSGSVVIRGEMGFPGGERMFLYSSETGGSALSVSSGYPYELVTPFVNTSTTFWLGSGYRESGCESSRRAVAVRVQPLPSSPFVRDASRCGAGRVTFTVFSGAESGVEYRLYDSLTGGSLLGVSGSFPYELTSPLIQSASTFYVSRYESGTGCESVRVPVVGTVSPGLGLPSASSVVRCGSGVVTFTGQMGAPSGTELRLYSSVSGGVPVAVSSSAPWLLSPGSVSASTVYYLESYNNLTGCRSERAPVQAQVVAVPSAPLAESDGPVCLGQTVNLRASGSGDASYLWFGPNGYSAVGSNVSFLLSDSRQAGLYSVVAVVGGCSSSASAVKVEVLPSPATPEAGFYSEYGSQRSLCVGEELNLEVKNYSSYPSGTRFYWVGADTFFTVTHPFPSIARVGLINEGDYYVYAIVGGCTSAVSNRVTVLVRPLPLVPVASNNGPLCASGGDLTLFATGSGSGVRYLWSGPNGFSAEGSSVSRPSALNNAGVYTVRAVSAEGCASPLVSTTVLINESPSRVFAQASGPICVGESLRLTAQGGGWGALYVWRGPNGFSWQGFGGEAVIEQVSVNASGVYTLTVVQGACTSEGSTVSVSVRPRPSSPQLLDNGPLCEGQTLRLTASGASGILVWLGPGGYVHTSVTPELERGNISFSDGGVYSLSVVSEGCTSAPAVRSVVVNRMPIITSVRNNGPLCVGQTLELSASASEGSTLYWSGPGGYNNTGSSISRQALSPGVGGVYTVTAVLGNCTSGVATTLVNVYARPVAPSISNDGPVCPGERANLRVSGSEVSTYLLQGPGGYQALGSGPVFTLPGASANQAGTYSVVAIVGGCTSSVSTTQLEVKPLPSTPVAGNNGPLCEGGVLRLEAGGSGGSEYIWYGPDGFMQKTSGSTVTRAGLSAGMAGVYTVIAVMGGCSSSSATTLVEVTAAPAAPGVGNNGPRCVGEVLQLTAIGPIGAEYVWSGPGGFSALGAQATRLLTGVSEGGVYTVYAVVGGCTSGVSSASVTVRPGVTVSGVRNSGPVCVGQTAVLSVDGAISGVTYRWSGPGGFSAVGSSVSRRINGLMDAGVYTVVASNGVCSSAAAVTNLVVLEVPSVYGAQSNGPVCSGGVLQLSAPYIEGVSYRWSGPSGFVSTERSPSIANVTTSHAGYYTVVASNGACVSEPAQVEVSVVAQPRAPVVSSNGPVCSGQSLQLSASSVAGAQYIWSGPGGWSSMEQNPVIGNATTSHSGQYTVMAVVGGCSSLASAVNVVVRAKPEAPVASSNGPLCAGQTLQLGASTIPGASYSWSGPNNFSSAVQNPVRVNASTLESGLYSVFAVLNGCRSEVSSVMATVNPVPVVSGVTSNSPVCAGENIQLGAPAISGGLYLWSGPGGWSSTAQNPVIGEATVLQSGVYSLVVSVNGCTSRVTSVSVSVRDCGPSCPVPLSVAAVGQSGGRATVSWQVPAVGNPVCYVVSYGVAGSDPSSWSQVLVPHPNRLVVVEGLLPNTVYQFRVRTNCTSCAVNSGVRSDWSPAVSATTPMAKEGVGLAAAGLLQVYPNPNRGEFMLAYTALESGLARVRLYDLGGRVVEERAWEVLEGSNALPYRLEGLGGGVYVVEVLQGESRYQARLQIVE
jgi:hypothetical protein